MATTRNVAVFVGSLRKESLNRKIAKALIAMAPEPLKLEIVEIGNLPLYNQDDDANPPAASAAFKQRVQQADAVLFVTPEYNRSVPGVLKNAIDVGSRPYGKSAWNGKPGARDQPVTRRDRRIRRQPCAAPVAGVPQRSGDAATRGLHRQRRRPVRRQRHPDQRSHQGVHAEIPGRLRQVDRGEHAALIACAAACAAELSARTSDHARSPRRWRARRRPT